MTKDITHREFWGTKVGFVFAAMGSAVGLANIIRFPYLVGENGGAAFIVIYLICLLILGFPIFLTELLIGRATHRNPYGAFYELGENKLWASMGGFAVFTGFFVSAFYAVVSGWVIGYLADAVQGSLSIIDSHQDAEKYFYQQVNLPIWAVGMQLSFILLSLFILYSGVRDGLERASKFLMPMLILFLLYLAMTGLDMSNSHKGLHFLFDIQWHEVTPTSCLLALGQAFFTLSLGQGTMITYGSYLNRKVNLIKISIPVVLADTLISILAAIAVFTIVFSVGMQPDSGIALMFKTLPIAFNALPNGYLLSVCFFSLVALAALTSQISAMEPLIAFFMDELGWKRSRAVLTCAVGVFLVGLPCALSYNFLSSYDFLATAVFIPLGGLFVALLVGWRWGANRALRQLHFGLEKIGLNRRFLECYYTVCIKYVSPVAIIAIAIQVLIE